MKTLQLPATSKGRVNLLDQLDMTVSNRGLLYQMAKKADTTLNNLWHGEAVQQEHALENVYTFGRLSEMNLDTPEGVEAALITAAKMEVSRKTREMRMTAGEKIVLIQAVLNQRYDSQL